MIQTETSKAKIIFVSVPSDARDFRIASIGSRILFMPKESYFVSDWIDIPQGNWTILNVLDDVTEDEAALISWDDEWFTSHIDALQHTATSLGVEGKTIILYQLK